LPIHYDSRKLPVQLLFSLHGNKENVRRKTEERKKERKKKFCC
jgi:hypothetical protein